MSRIMWASYGRWRKISTSRCPTEVLSLSRDKSTWVYVPPTLLCRRGKLKLAKQITCRCAENAIFHFHPTVIAKGWAGIFKVCMNELGVCGGRRGIVFGRTATLKTTAVVAFWGEEGTWELKGHKWGAICSARYSWGRWALSERRHNLSSQITEEIWLTVDKLHLHLALTTIGLGITARQIPVSSWRKDASLITL